MITGHMVKVMKEKVVDVGDAALTMAIGIIIERVSRLPPEDQQELYELVKGLGGTQDPEEVEAIRVAIHEILDQEPSGAKILDPKTMKARPDKLQKWVEFVGARIQELRKSRGLTQVQLAEKSGLPQSHISRIESARLSPSRATLDKIARAMDVQISALDPSA